MNTKTAVLPAVALLAAPMTVHAAIIVDGSLDADYGAPIVVQTVDTQFGDAQPPASVSGSELDGAYARIEGGRLFLLFTGNQEPNLNKLEVFIDSRPGGESTLSGTPDYDFSPVPGSWISNNLVGLTFDTGFTADFHLYTAWCCGPAPGPYAVGFVDRAGGLSEMVAGSSGTGSTAAGLVSSGAIAAGNVATNASGTALSQQLLFAINDNNAAGVGGGIGPPSGDPAAMIGNGDHNYISNQVLGGLPVGTGNLGGDGSGGFSGTLSGVDFRQFSANQYFSIRVTDDADLPEPGALALLCLGFAGIAVSRRSRSIDRPRRADARTTNRRIRS